MNQNDPENKLLSKAKTRKASVLGIFIMLIGILVLVVGPTGYFESMSSRVADSNKYGIGALIWGMVIGAALFILGLWMIKLRRKIKKEDVSDKIEITQYVTILDSRVAVFPSKIAKIILSPDGITFPEIPDGESPLSIRWAEVTKSDWRLVYNSDAYQISTSRYEIILSYTNPAESRSGARKYWKSSAFLPSVAKDAYATKLSVDNIKDISNLSPIHIYSLFYAGSVTSKWSNFFDKFLFTQLSQIAVVVILTFWLLGITHGFDNKSLEPIILFPVPIIVFGLVFYNYNNELKLSRKVVGL